MSINEKTKINITLVTAISSIVFLVVAAYAVGIKQAEFEKDLANQEKITSEHIKAEYKKDSDYLEFKFDIYDRLVRMEQGIEDIKKWSDKQSEMYDRLARMEEGIKSIQKRDNK